MMPPSDHYGYLSFLADAAKILAVLISGLAVALLLQLRSAGRQPIRTRLEALASIRGTQVVETAFDIQDIEAEFQEDDQSFKNALHRAYVRLTSSIPPMGLRVMAVAATITFVAVALFLKRLGWYSDLIVLMMSGAVGGGIASYIHGHYAEKVKLSFLNNFPDAVELIVRATKAGIPLSEAIASVAKEAEEPIRSEFRRMADAMAVGVDFMQVLRVSAQKINLPDFQFFIVCLVIQRESGGQIAETLGSLASVLRKRKEMRQKVRALTAEPRLSGKIIAALPVAICGFLAVFNPGYMSLLLDDPEIQPLLVSAVVMVSIGLVIIDTMTRFKQR